MSKTKSRNLKSSEDPPCTIFTITQYECSPANGKITCWPLERVFRQCGKNGPAIEVTSYVTPSKDDPSKPMISPAILANPPRGRLWADLLPEDRRPEIKGDEA